MQTPSGLVRLRQLVEKFEKQWAINHVFKAVRLVDDLFDETFLYGDDSVVEDLSCEVAEKTVDDKVENLVHLQMVNGHLLLAVGY